MRTTSAFQLIPSYGSLETSLVSHWKLDDVNDNFGSNNLTNNNTVTFTSAKVGNGADFGSANTNKSLSNSGSIGGGGTKSFSFWVKLNTEIASGNWGFFMSSDAGTDTAMYVQYQYNAGTRRLSFFRARSGVTFGQGDYTVTLGTSSWYHIAFVYNGTTSKGYLNGVEVTSVTDSGNGTNNDVLNGFRIGSSNNYTTGVVSDFSSSIIDEFSIWTKALSTDEITILYNSGNGRNYPFTTTTKAYYPLNGNPAGSLKDGAVAYWRLDESSGNATDLVGGYTLTNNNTITYTTGKISNGATLNGSSQYFSSASSIIPSSTSPFTISAWVKLASLSGAQTIYAQGADSANGSIQFRYNGSNFQFILKNSVGTTASVSTTTSLSTGVWYYLVAVYDSSNIYIYLNTVSEGNTTASGTVGGAASRIGRQELVGFYYYWNGMLDEVGIWNKALTTDEISRLYNAGNGQQLETRALDYSGNGNHGTETAITYPQGRFGQGAKFNGSSSKIAIGSTSTLQLSSPITISLWFKTSDTGTQILFSKDSQATGGYIGYGLYTSFLATGDVAMRVRTATGAVFSDLGSGGYYTDGRWHNVVGTYNAGSQVIYVDGIRRNSGGSGTDIFWATPQIPNIGTSSVSDNWFDGTIDEVIIESRAWTAKEVETYYRKSTLNYRQKTFGQMIWTYTSELLKGQYTLTGKNVNTLYNRVATLLKGAYTLTGKQLTANKAYVATLLKGTYNLVGKILTVPNRWTNQSKSSSTWTNESKNSSTWTNESKNSSTWTNENKS